MKITKKQLNKIKMIVCDLDGTLFNRKKEISSATITYLIKLQENGYTLVLATGRFFYELKPYIEQLQLEKYHGYVICCNGIEIYDLTHNKCRSFSFLEQIEINELLQLALYYRLNIRANFDHKYQMILNNWLYFLIPLIRIFTKRYPDLTFYKNTAVVPWNKLGKICLLSSPRKLKLFEAAAQTKFPGLYQYYYTNPYCVEVVKAEVNKCYAVKYLCQLNNLNLENVLAFGDSGNDEELLNNAGIGIIMKNGLSSLKKKATYLTFKNNRHEGVLNMLEYLFDDLIKDKN